MLPANLISALQVLSRSDKPLITTGRDMPSPAGKDAPNAANKLEPGQQLQGAVQAKISEGLFKVQVAGQALQMRLPANIQVGDVIKLQVVSAQPRITFSMVASTNPLSTPEQIGSSAQILSNLADRPLERPLVQQLGSKASADQPGRASSSAAPNTVTGNVELARQQLSEQAQTSSPSASHMTHNKPGEEATLPIAKELIPMVQQQLHTLEQHHLVWMGQVWPGQQMQWEIQGEPDQHAREQPERQWSTEMELALPNLGGVHAHLAFSGSGLRLTLHAADTQTVELFNRALPALKNSLADANIPLISGVVEKS
ncbi:MAG: flagellar hook-length control protein FliK [Nitrosomonadales bacterium]|nr:flagellar hook-length control protein FliK [Nitrosomonadales bacterium]